MSWWGGINDGGNWIRIKRPAGSLSGRSLGLCMSQWATLVHGELALVSPANIIFVFGIFLCEIFTGSRQWRGGSKWSAIKWNFSATEQEQSSGKRAEEFSTTGCTMCTRPICVYALYPHTAVHLTHLVVTLSLVFPLSYLGARYHTQAGARKAKEKKRESEPTYSYFVGGQCFQGRTALHWELELP